MELKPTMPDVASRETEKYIIRDTRLETSITKLELLRSKVDEASKRIIEACQGHGEKFNITAVEGARSTYEIALAEYENELNSLLGGGVIH